MLTTFLYQGRVMSSEETPTAVVEDQEKRATQTSGGKKKPRGGATSSQAAVILIALALIVGLTSFSWWPALTAALDRSKAENAHGHSHDAQGGHGGNDDHGHDHGAHGESDVNTLDITAQGRKNIGLTMATVGVADFRKTITLMAILEERVGRSQITVAAPMTGIITRVYPIRGEAVTPGAPLFDLRLTHEDLVENQTALLRSLEELDVVQQEVARLNEVTASGAVAGKRLLEREYEQKKIEAVIRAERQALLLHGLSEEQIKQIEESRRLISSVTLSAPSMADCQTCGQQEPLLQVSELFARLGQHVATGSQLATLTDHCELYVEGNAFERDGEMLNRAARDGVDVTVQVGEAESQQTIEGLRIQHVENSVDRESRALKFYVGLPNELIRNEKTESGQRFIAWRYKPGQRVDVLVPVKTLKQRLVLPIEAVIEDGMEAYVYQEVKGGFKQCPVHVENRDQRYAAVASDGSIFPGDKIAVRGAYEIHQALKNKAGGGVDPHAGHGH